MKNWWIRFGCFLTGHNYQILRNSSEVAAKSVKKYTAAILIVGIIWAFVGYMFTERYLHGGKTGSIIGAILMVVIIVQIERQIILSIRPTKLLMLSRMLIACMMALLGAIIVDQIIFKEDIELEKMGYIQTRVDSLVKIKSKELRMQITDLDTNIARNENEHQNLFKQVTEKPYIDSIIETSEVKLIRESEPDGAGGYRTVEKPRRFPLVTKIKVANPKYRQIASIDKQLEDLRKGKETKENMLLAIRPKIEKEITQKVGFLDELEIMSKLISRSRVAFFVWLLWFLFLFGLEMLVLISKISEKTDDYGNIVQHQMDINNRKLELLSKMGNNAKQ